jgi:hypothetical protein
MAAALPPGAIERGNDRVRREERRRADFYEWRHDL